MDTYPKGRDSWPDRDRMPYPGDGDSDMAELPPVPSREPDEAPPAA